MHGQLQSLPIDHSAPKYHLENFYSLLFKTELGECADWIIVGAGLSGIYASWILQKHYPNSSSHILFESSDRIGGRIYTSIFSNDTDAKLEFGEAFFIPQLHPLVNQTVHALNLETKPYIEDYLLSDGLYHLRGRSLRHWQLNTSSDVPYNMDPGELGLWPYDLYR